MWDVGCGMWDVGRYIPVETKDRPPSPSLLLARSPRGRVFEQLRRALAVVEAHHNAEPRGMADAKVGSGVYAMADLIHRNQDDGLQELKTRETGVFYGEQSLEHGYVASVCSGGYSERKRLGE